MPYVTNPSQLQTLFSAAHTLPAVALAPQADAVAPPLHCMVLSGDIANSLMYVLAEPRVMPMYLVTCVFDNCERAHMESCKGKTRQQLKHEQNHLHCACSTHSITSIDSACNRALFTPTLLWTNGGRSIIILECQRGRDKRSGSTYCTSWSGSKDTVSAAEPKLLTSVLDTPLTSQIPLLQVHDA